MKNLSKKKTDKNKSVVNCVINFFKELFSPITNFFENIKKALFPTEKEAAGTSIAPREETPTWCQVFKECIGLEEPGTRRLERKKREQEHKKILDMRIEISERAIENYRKGKKDTKYGGLSVF